MYTPHPIGLQVSLDLVPGYGSSVASGSVSGLRRFQIRQVPRAPLHGSRCYLSRQSVLHPVSRRDSAFIAPTGSCANPKPSPRLGITLAHGVFTGCYQPLLGVGPSRPYLCESFPTCLDPYPGGPQGAFTRFFPQGVGLPRSCSGSALHHILDSHFSPGGLFGAAAISSCSGPPVCLPPRWLPPLRPFQASGSRGFYFWASHSSLPPRGPDRLAVRIEQLTAGRLALPKIRSLVGCTARPDPLSLHAHRECRDARSSQFLWRLDLDKKPEQRQVINDLQRARDYERPSKRREGQ